MSYFFQDLIGLALGTLIAPILLYAPGFAILRLLERAGFPTATGWRRVGWALILSLSLLPAIDALLVRATGMAGMVAFHAVLLIYALRFFPRANWRMPVFFATLFALWWVIVAIAYLDFDLGAQFNQTLLTVDLVKHAAVVDAIAHDGLPLHDLFFAREGVAGYYYYFYLWPAAIEWASGFAISPRMAFAAADVWTGVAVPALFWRLAADLGLIRPGRERRFLVIVTLLCFVTGVDIVFLVLRYVLTGHVAPQVDLWNEEIRFVLTSVLWVPHHITALIACWCGMLLLGRARAADAPLRWWLAGSAGLAFATCFGSSVWIMLTAAPILALWGAFALFRRDPVILCAGLIATILCVFQISDLMHGRVDSGPPLAFAIRRFASIIPSESLGATLFCLFILPLNYALEFGFFAYGTNLYWRGRKARLLSSELAAVTLACALFSLVAAGLLRSVIINNDFGWRSVLFAQVPAIVWTAHVLQSRKLLRPSLLAIALLTVGVAGNIWDIFGMRMVRPPYFDTDWRRASGMAANDREQRAAYEWAAVHVPRRRTIQHNAALYRRMMNFGLYGSHMPGVADSGANLFGASKRDVDDRIATITPIFVRPLSTVEIGQRARSARVDYLFFTDLDPVWRKTGGPPYGLTCIYRNRRVCIAPVPGMGR